MQTHRTAPPRRVWAAVATLIVLSPVLAELLMGALPVSKLWLLIPEMSVYGVGALLIREVTRRRGRGWGMTLLLGVAFSIAEECVILQTSLTPQFSHFGDNFGWAAGVQWNYLAAMLLYESVYAIVLPITLTEILFPEQREVPWLSRRGLGIAAICFILGSIGVWLLWTRVGLAAYGPSDYQAPPSAIAVALAAIAAIVAAALSLKPPAPRPAEPGHWALRPWLVGLMAFLFGLSWFVVIALGFIPARQVHGASPLISVAAAAIWAGIALLVIRRLSTARGWGDRHRLALIFGMTLATLIGGILTVLAAGPVDQIGKAVLDLVAVVLFIILLRRVWDRTALQPA